MNMETTEVDQFASGIDLCLEGILALSKHRGAVHVRPVFRSDEIRRLQKYICSRLPRHCSPVLARSKRRFHCLYNVLLTTRGKMSKGMIRFMWRMYRNLLRSSHFLAANIHRYVEFTLLQFSKYFL